MIKRRIMKKKGTSLLMVVLTTLTVALSGCSSDKAGDSANSSQTPATSTDTASSEQAGADTGANGAQFDLKNQRMEQHVYKIWADITSSSLKDEGMTINISKDSVDLQLTEQIKLTATVTPANASNKVISWHSTNSDIATVENGNVTAIGIGKCDIIATCFGIAPHSKTIQNIHKNRRQRSDPN